LNFVDGFTAEVFPRPKHYLLSPVNFFPLAILQEVYDKAGDRIFWRLGQLDHIHYFLHHPVSLRHVSENLRIGSQYVSLQRQFGSRSSILLFFGAGAFS